MSVWAISHRTSGAMIDPGMLKFDRRELKFYLFRSKNFSHLKSHYLLILSYPLYAMPFIPILPAYWQFLQIIYPFTISPECSPLPAWPYQYVEIHLIVIYCNRRPVTDGCCQTKK